MILCALFLMLLINASSLNLVNTKALVKKIDNQLNVNSFNRYYWKWNTTEVISTESGDDSYLPSIATDTFSNIHVAWQDTTNYLGSGSDADVFYKRWDASTFSWTITEVVSTESTDNSYWPSLAVDDFGNIHVAWMDDTDYTGCGTESDIFYKCWNTSSSSWTITEVVSTESTAESFYPSLAVDSSGNIHIVWSDLTNYIGSGSDFDIFYKCWNASSSVWTTTEVVSTESTGDSEFVSLAVDSFNNVHITWNDRTNYAGSGSDTDIFYKRWDASSSTWTTTEVVSTESTLSSAVPSLAVDFVGNVHIAWYDSTDYDGAGEFDFDIFYKRWDTFTSLWTKTEFISTESTSDSDSPSIAVDSVGTVHIAWLDYSDYAGSGLIEDIFYKCWIPSSNFWIKTEVVSIESTSFSFNPCITVDCADNVHFTWEDSTNYAGAGGDWDIFHKIFGSPPESPELAFLVPNPTDINSVFLDWKNVPGATKYYVYRSNSFIWFVEELTPIANIHSSEFVNILPSEGFYYYVVVAENFAGNSSISNCQYIEYKLPHVQEFIIISSLIFGTFILVFVVTRSRKKLKLN